MALDERVISEALNERGERHVSVEHHLVFSFKAPNYNLYFDSNRNAVHPAELSFLERGHVYEMVETPDGRSHVSTVMRIADDETRQLLAGLRFRNEDPKLVKKHPQGVIDQIGALSFRWSLPEEDASVFRQRVEANGGVFTESVHTAQDVREKVDECVRVIQELRKGAQELHNRYAALSGPEEAETLYTDVLRLEERLYSLRERVVETRAFYADVTKACQKAEVRSEMELAMIPLSRHHPPEPSELQSLAASIRNFLAEGRLEAHTTLAEGLATLRAFFPVLKHVVASGNDEIIINVRGAKIALTENNFSIEGDTAHLHKGATGSQINNDADVLRRGIGSWGRRAPGEEIP